MQKPDQQLFVLDHNEPNQGDRPTATEILARLHEGWRCVRFEFCVSFFLITLRFQSRIYLTNSWQQRYIRGTGYILLSLLLGPWGIPWGPVWVVRAIWTNLTGGLDLTDRVRATLKPASSLA